MEENLGNYGKKPVTKVEPLPWELTNFRLICGVVVHGYKNNRVGHIGGNFWLLDDEESKS